MTKGLHDHPGMYPILPGREVDQEQLDEFAPPGSEFRAAWEFALSHELTEAERSAFWHGVNIQHRAGASSTWTTDQVEEFVRQAVDLDRTAQSVRRAAAEPAFVAEARTCLKCVANSGRVPPPPPPEFFDPPSVNPTVPDNSPRALLDECTAERDCPARLHVSDCPKDGGQG